MTRYDPKATPGASERSVGRNSEGQEITPLEAVMAKPGVDKLHEIAEAKPPEPVRLDGLKAVRRRGGPGPGVLPGGDGTQIPMVPRMTRTIPAPYQRQSIDWDNRHHGKTWGYLAASEVQPGDIVVGFGKVGATVPYVVYEPVNGVEHVAVREEICLVNVMTADRMIVRSDDQLRVFRVHAD